MQHKSIQLAAVLLLAFATAAVANDWALWRGPEHNGISREKNLPESWSLKDKQNVAWESDIGGRSTPILLNGRLYINCRTLDDVNDPVEKVHAREQVVCLDANTGKVVWKDVFNVFQTDVAAPRVGWAAMAGDTETGNVYVHSVSGVFRCYDKDGKPQWEHSLFEEFGKISGYGGRTVTPIVDEDRVILTFFGLSWGKNAVPPPKQTFYAFDKFDGRLLWTSAVGGAPKDTIYSNPIVAVINGVRMLISGGADGGVQAINARTGEPIWSFDMSKRGLNATPVVDGNLVYISHGEDNVDSAAFGRIECIDATGTGDVTATHSKWRIDDIKAGYTGLLVKDKILYVVADTGNLHAFDSETGEPLWKHNLGTVGKGSPIWADGKIYATEVNGNFHILKPSREGCQSLSHVEIPAGNGEGVDEIYSSPAAYNGRIYLVTRDRTLCIGPAEPQESSEPIPPLPAEKPAADKIAFLHLAPADTYLWSGESVKYELYCYDANGSFIKKAAPESLEFAALPGATADGASVGFAADAATQAGTVVAKLGDLSAEARLRCFSQLPWKFEFSELKEKQVPPGWITAFLKLQPTSDEGDANVFMRNKPGPGKPSVSIWLGPPEMKGYTIQADVRLHEVKRKMSSAGVTCQRYDFILKGNTGKLAIQTWAPHMRINAETSFRSDPMVWYTMKVKVDITDDGATIRGKVWDRSKEEPAEWTLEGFDPHPNFEGSPGLYTYAMAPSDIDNVLVTKE